jgi:hypothetical protein
MSNIITLTTVGIVFSYNLYVIYSSRKKSRKQHLEVYKKLLNGFDLKEVNQLMEVVKKEMNELPVKSSLTPVQKAEVINYCELLLFHYFEDDFTLERRKLCFSILKYCHIEKHEKFFTDSIYYRKIMERLV